MDKRSLIQKIVERLDETLARFADAARVSAADATDEHNRAENKYDTRATEASYLAAGQGRQALEIVAARAAFTALDPREFGPDEPVAPGALAQVDDAGETRWYFLGPSAGGTAVEHEGREVLVVTTQSPLGQRMLGAKVGTSLPGGLRVTAVF